MAADSPLLLLSDDLLDDAADVPAEEADVEAAATGPPMGLAAYTRLFALLLPPPGAADAIIVLAAFVCAAVVVVSLGIILLSPKLSANFICPFPVTR